MQFMAAYHQLSTIIITLESEKILIFLHYVAAISTFALCLCNVSQSEERKEELQEEIPGGSP